MENREAPQCTMANREAPHEELREVQSEGTKEQRERRILYFSLIKGYFEILKLRIRVDIVHPFCILIFNWSQTGNLCYPIHFV